MRFPFKNGDMLNGAASEPYSEFLPDNIVGGTNVRFFFNTVLNIRIPSIIPANGASISIEIIINLDTSYSLDKDPLGAVNSWGASGSTAKWLIGANQSTNIIPLAFITDEIPSGIYGTNAFSIAVTDVVDSITGSSLLFYAARSINSTSLTYATTIEGEQSFIPYEVGNVLGVVNSYDIEETDAIMGELYNPTYYGALYTGDTSSWNPSSGQWRYKDTGVAYSFNFLRVRETMAAQIKAVPKYQGAVVGASSVYPHASIIYDGSVYILNGGEYSANDETWDGEWFKVDYNRASVEDIEGDTAEDDGGGTESLYRAIGAISDTMGLFQLKGGSQFVNIISTNTTISPFAQIVHCTAATTQTLSPAADWIVNGKSIEIAIKNVAGVGDTVTIDGDGSETIDGATTITLNQYESAILYSDGTNIFIK